MARRWSAGKKGVRLVFALSPFSTKLNDPCFRVRERTLEAEFGTEQKRGQAGFRSVPFFNKVEWPLFSGQQPVPALAVSFLGLRGTGMMSLSPRKVATMVVPPMVGPGGET
jgi:hypothetical protein